MTIIPPLFYEDNLDMISYTRSVHFLTSSMSIARPSTTSATKFPSMGLWCYLKDIAILQADYAQKNPSNVVIRCGWNVTAPKAMSDISRKGCKWSSIETQLGGKAVKSLTADLKSKGHHLCFDNYLISPGTLA